jgi:hypothetical protein
VVQALAIEGQETRVAAEWHASGAARILDAIHPPEEVQP